MAEIENEIEPFEDSEDEGEDIEVSDEEEDDGEYMADLADVLGSYLTTEDDNVCSAMLRVSKQLETQNKIMVKILTQLTHLAQKGS